MVNNASGSTPLGAAPASNAMAHRTPVSRDTTDTTSTTQHTVKSWESEPAFAGEAVKRIEPIIELFRAEKIRKSQAIFRIGQVLAMEPTGNEELKSSALEQYTGTLDRIESLAATVNKHGARVIGTGPMHERRVSESGKRSRGLAELDRYNDADGPGEGDVDHFLAKLSKGFEPGVGQGEKGEGSESGDDSG